MNPIIPMYSAEAMTMISNNHVKHEKDRLSFVIASYILSKAKLSAEKGLYHYLYSADDAYADLVSEIIDILKDLGYRVIRIGDVDIIIEWGK